MTTSPRIELQFPVLGQAFPVDHGYLLYSALSGHLPWLHCDRASSGSRTRESSGHARSRTRESSGPGTRESSGSGTRESSGSGSRTRESSGPTAASFHDGTAIAVGPIAGQWTGHGLLAVCPRRSHLRLRLASEQIPLVLGLAGNSLDLAGHRLRLGVPSVHALAPAPSLVARLVTIKHAIEPECFLAAARVKLNELQIAAEPGIPVLTDGARQGEPRRKILRIRDKKVVGFALQVTGLTAEESIRLQECGLGGRRKMGCGFFVPLKGEAE